MRYEQGSAQTPWRWVAFAQAEEDLVYAQGQFAYPKRRLAGLTLQPQAVNTILIGICAVACLWTALEIWDRWNKCQDTCKGSGTPTTCLLGCLIEACEENLLNGAMCAGCGCCILAATRHPALRDLCKKLWDVVRKVLDRVRK